MADLTPENDPLTGLELSPNGFPLAAAEALEHLTTWRRNCDVLTSQVANEALVQLGSEMRVVECELARPGLCEIARLWLKRDPLTVGGAR